jgi:hypothetical protein
MGFLHIQRQLEFAFQKGAAFLANGLGMGLRPFDNDDKVSRAAEFHHRALAEPDVRLSPHPAPIVRPRP